MDIKNQLAFLAMPMIPLGNISGHCLITIPRIQAGVPQSHIHPPMWGRAALRHLFLLSGYPNWGCFSMTFNFPRGGAGPSEKVNPIRNEKVECVLLEKVSQTQRIICTLCEAAF